MKFKLLLVVGSLLLVGCASSPKVPLEPSEEISLNAVVSQPALNFQLFGETQNLKVIQESQIYQLDEDVKRDFLQFFNRPELQLQSGAQRVSSYIGLLMDGFTYSQHTRTAQETIDEAGGNCLSLTLLTTALANLAGVEVSYDLLNSDPTFALDNDVLVTSDHMRAVLLSDWDTDGEAIFSLRGRITIDFFDTQGMAFLENVSPQYQLSLYYSNRAVETMLEGNDTQAFALAERSLHIDPSNDSALNTLAILHRRHGDVDTAESLYQFGLIDTERDSGVFYRNYLALLETEGRFEDLAQLKSAYSKKQKKHPLEWIRAGKKAHREGQFELAMRLYDRALELVPDLHGVHLLSAKAAVAMGRTDVGKEQLRLAVTASNTDGQSRLYQRKLAKFKKFEARPSN